MEYLSNIGGYLALCLATFYIMYMNAVDFEFRLDRSNVDNSTLWRYIITEQREILKLLRHDFLRVHCPWSKKRSIKYRVQDAHKLLQHCKHEKGWTAEDCHDEANHAQIAHDCFVYRSTFWTQQMFILLTSPARLILMVIVVIVAVLVMMAYDGAVKSFRFVFSRT